MEMIKEKERFFQDEDFPIFWYEFWSSSWSSSLKMLYVRISIWQFNRKKTKAWAYIA